MNATTKNKMPAIRFAGFSGNWIKSDFSKIYSFVRNGFVGTATPYYVDNGIPYIQGRNIKEGMLLDNGYVNISEEFHKSKPNSKVKVNDLLIVQSGHVGETAVVCSKLDGANCHAVLVATPAEQSECNSHFYNNYFLSDFGKAKITLITTGNTIKHILSSDLKMLTVPKPIYQEQTQIGDFFQQMDKLIELQSRAVESAETYKKAMLQKMFPQKGEKVPQVRFAGFSGDWNITDLGSIGKVKSGIGFPEAEQNSVGKIPFFKVSDMNLPGNENSMLNANNYVNQTQIMSNKWKVIDDIPSIIFAKVGAAIFLNRKRLVNFPFLIDNNMMAYSFDKTWDQSFAKTLFDTLFLPRFAQVGALPSMNGGDITSIKVLLPFKEEQTAIGNYFQKLDQKIEAEKKKLEQYQTMKRAMLQRMFV